MNRNLLSVALVLVLATAALAAVTEEVVNEDSRHPGKCYDAKRNEGYAVGAKWHRIKEPCTELSCERHREPGKYVIKKTTCETVRPKAGCTIEEGNRRANYPRCCNSLKCPNQG
ncbi:hypothetical protein R5R35_008958 [Gryllus longicercus]|uniref:Single domain-containing protein n=1 Tax=Gryllus longicercus TaxID=2509291 RepID=A0AAN9Z6I7_9ORTH|nr:uncharacterized protein GBIM_18295 [Gryllus bimaculatus]